MARDPEVLWQRLLHADMHGLPNGMSAEDYIKKTCCGHYYVVDAIHGWVSGVGKVSGL